jgi:hypothetical protein
MAKAKIVTEIDNFFMLILPPRLNSAGDAFCPSPNGLRPRASADLDRW